MLQSICYVALTIYTWALMTFFQLPEELKGVQYALTVAPAAVLIGVSIPTYLRLRFSPAEMVLGVFLLIAGAIAAARHDFPTLISLGALCGVLIAIHASRMSVGVSLTNVLFFATWLAAIIMHSLGMGTYGQFPGDSSGDDINWRISLFVYNVTPSWLLSLVVIAVNYFHNRGIPRLIMVSLGMYFLIFSASRTGMIILGLWAAFVLATRLVKFEDRAFYRLFIPCSVLIFVLAMNSELILVALSHVDSPLLNAILFKSTVGVSSAEQASTSIERTVLWAAHLDIFLGNPWLGHGTFVLADEASDFLLKDSTGSEAFITALFARTGVVALLFVWFMYLLSIEAIRLRDRCGYCLLIFFTISSLAYGSYIVPYNFIFLMLFGALNYSRLRASAASDWQRHEWHSTSSEEAINISA